MDAMLAAKGAQVLDADLVVRDLQAKDQPVWQAIVDRFGKSILRTDGELDRAKLGQLVFADPQALADLEAIVHPAVRDEERRRILTAPPGSVLVIDAVKLIESGMGAACDALWVVTAPAQQQTERLMRQRGLSEADARLRIEAQSPQDEKARQAAVVIANAGTLADTQHQVDEAWKRTAGAWVAK